MAAPAALAGGVQRAAQRRRRREWSGEEGGVGGGGGDVVVRGLGLPQQQLRAAVDAHDPRRPVVPKQPAPAGRVTFASKNTVAPRRSLTSR